MPYRLTQFGSVLLPLAEATFDLEPAPAATGFIELPDGSAFDVWRSEEAPQRFPHTIDLAADLVEGTAAALRTAYEALSGLVGQRERLWRATSDGYYHWCWARVEKLRGQRAPRNVFWQANRLGFVQIGPWHGEGHGGAWNLDDGHYFDSGLWFDDTGATELDGDDDIVLTNSGNRQVTDCGITLTAGDAAVTSLAVTIAGVAQFTWSGTLAAGNSLVIDCGAKTVKNNGVGAYGGFALGAEHYSPWWLPLAANTSTSVNVVVDGVVEFSTPPNIQFTYSDGWK